MKTMRTLAVLLLLGGQLPAAALAGQATPAAQSGYVLGADDEIEMNVFGQPDMAIKTRIKSDGTVNLPFLGTVKAAGSTVAQLVETVSAAYRKGGYLTDPSINIEVTNYVSRSATVLGNVPNAGNYPLDRGYTIATLIARAGGIRADGANVVILTHADGTPPQRVQLADLQGGASIPIRPGDTLFVPVAELVYVYGQVNQPGAFPFQPGTTYRQALAKAGGPTLAGSTRKIEVRRGGEAVKGVKLDDVAQPEDVLVIKEKLF